MKPKADLATFLTAFPLRYLLPGLLLLSSLILSALYAQHRIQA